MLNRRTFTKALMGLPFVGWLFGGKEEAWTGMGEGTQALIHAHKELEPGKPIELAPGQIYHDVSGSISYCYLLLFVEYEDRVRTDHWRVAQFQFIDERERLCGAWIKSSITERDLRKMEYNGSLLGLTPSLMGVYYETATKKTEERLAMT